MSQPDPREPECQAQQPVEQMEPEIPAIPQQNANQALEVPQQAELRNPTEKDDKQEPVVSENEKSQSKELENNEGSEHDGHEDEDKDDEDGEKKDSSDENREDNDTSQIQTIGGKKCFNKLCNSKKIYKKIRSKVQTQRYRFLCKNCYDNYVKNYFCQFCEQIYSNYENEDDDTKWVGCDKCDKWNHIECERKYRNKNFEISKDKDTQYQCISCSKKGRTSLPAPDNNQHEVKRKVVERDYEGTRNYRPKIQISKDERIPIFHKKPETFPCLQSFLQTYNFRLWLNDASVREDIQTLRSLGRRPTLEEEPKKVKKIKMDY